MPYLDKLINKLNDAVINCDNCSGGCCKMNYPIYLTEKEVNKYEYEIRDDIKCIKYIDGVCIYYSEKDKCTIHHDKPKICRSYDCRIHGNKIPNTKYYGE